MSQQSQWLSRSGASEYLDVSPDTVERRAIAWKSEPIEGRIRWKFLKLGDDTRQERRYYVADLESLLVVP